MPPKPRFSQADIVDGAFEIARSQGLPKLTARAVAERLGCSTSPIYSAFKSMDRLEEEVCRRSTEQMLVFQTTSRTGSPFWDMALGYVLFAQAERRLFRDMFMNIDTLKPFSRKMMAFAFEELKEKGLNDEPTLTSLTARQKEELLQAVWIVAHGIATQINIQARPQMTEKELLALLGNLLGPIMEKMSAAPLC